MKIIQPDEDGKTKCIECNQVIHRSDDYYWSKRKGKPGGVNFIHKGCYENLISNKIGGE